MSTLNSPLGGISVKLSNALSGVMATFGNGSDVNLDRPTSANIHIAKYADLSNWVDREKFINFEGMVVRIPVGLKVNYHTYLEALEKVWSYLGRIEKDLLKPVSASLGQAANNTAALRLPIGYKASSVSAALLENDAVAVTELIAVCFDKVGKEQGKFGEVFRGARDVEAIAVRLKALSELVSEVSRRKINNYVNDISEAIDVIVEDDVHATPMKELDKVTSATAEWVELYGLFLSQLKAIETCMEEMSDKVQGLIKKDKRR